MSGSYPKHLGRRGTPWRRIQAQVFATETHCALCLEWVDQSLHHNHDKARSVHHIESPSDRPDLALERSNLRLAHRDCNWRAGQGGAPPTPRPPSRPWH
jgi:5-methylcytosine-specific restriction endonuclease McrA